MPAITEAQKKNNIIIEEAQNDLGKAEERHYPIKEPLLKNTFGSIVSNLSLTKYYDEDSGSYNDPVPTYSLYFTENMVGADGKPVTKYTNIPLPKDSESVKAFADHLLKVAKAIDGISLRSSAAAVDDLDAAMSKLNRFRKA